MRGTQAIVSEKDRENADALRDLVNSYVSLGDLSVQLAGRSSATDARRHFDEAKQWYESALAVLNAVQANTTGTKSDGEELDRIHTKLASLPR